MDERAAYESDVAAVTQNAVTQNAVSQNAVTQNAVTQNAVTQNAVTQNALSSDVMEDGRLLLDTNHIDVSTEDKRMFIEYVARCALDPEDILVAVVDGQQYEFPGHLGIAPEWTNHPISQSREQAISACLMAHVNHYGIPVYFSLRGLGQSVSNDEVQRFPWYEATYFGDLFVATVDAQEKYVCGGDPTPDFAAGFPHPAGDRLLRRCSDLDGSGSNTTMCGFTYVGACSDICDLNADGSILRCHADGKFYNQTAHAWVLSYDDQDTALTDDLYQALFGN